MQTKSIGAPAPVAFNFNSNEVRIIDCNGEPWFVAKDVCDALGYQNSRSAVADHLDDDERSTVANADSRNGGGLLTIISESGLYALVLRSRKPEARKFAKWVTSEVLPSIRKTGRYGVSVALPDTHPSINVRELLLTGQSDPVVPLPAGIQAAIDKKAWAMAGEAFELCREHLERRVAWTSVSGQPHSLNRASALEAISEGDLGDALAHTYRNKLRHVAVMADSAARTATEFLGEINALIGIAE